MTKQFLASALVLACAATTSQAQQTQAPAAAVQQHRELTPPAHAGAQAMPQSATAGNLQQQDRQFMTQAAQSGQAEVAGGQLAAERATDPALREFGRKLAHDHRAANVQLDQIARSKGIAPPAGLSVQQQEQQQRLQGLSGEAFDREFTQQMVRAHREAIELFRTEAQAEGRDPALRGFARQNLPDLQEHLATLESIQARAGQAGSDTRTSGSAAAPAGRAPSTER